MLLGMAQVASAATVLFHLVEPTANERSATAPNCRKKLVGNSLHGDRGVARALRAHIDVVLRRLPGREQLRHPVRPGHQISCRRLRGR